MSHTGRAGWLLVCSILLTGAGGRSAADLPRRDHHGDPVPEGAVARLGTLRWRTGSNVALCQFLDDGKALLTVNQEAQAQVWDVATGRELRRFDASAGVAAPRAGAAVIARLSLPLLNGGAAISGDGRLLAVSGNDGQVHLWDVRTGQEKRALATGAPTRARMALSPDGARIAIQATDGSLGVWETATGNKIAQFGAPDAGGLRTYSYRLGFSRDGKTVIQGGMERGNAAGVALTPVIICWDVASAKEARRITGLPAGNSLLLHYSTFSPDGRWIALPDAGKLHLVDVEAGKVVRVLAGQGMERAYNLVFDRTSRTLLQLRAPTGKPASLTVYDLTTGQAVSRGDAPAPAPAPVAGAAVIVSSSRLLGGLALSPDGKTLAWADGASLKLLDVPTGKERPISSGHTTAINEIVFSADGKTVLTRGIDASLCRWEADTGRPAGAVAAGRRLTTTEGLSPDEKHLLTGTPDGALHLLNAATGQERHTIPGTGQAYTQAVAFTADSRIAAALQSLSGQGQQVVRLVDTATGKPGPTITLPAPGQVGVGGLLVRSRLPARRLIFSPDGRLLLTDCHPVVVWETATGREHRQLPLGDDEGLRHAVFTPDGRAVAVETVGGGLTIWELATGKKRRTLSEAPKLQAAAGAVAGGVAGAAVLVTSARSDSRNPHSLAFAPDGRLLVQAADDGKARVWDVWAGKEVATLTGHQGSLTAAAFSCDGRRLATGGVDTTALVWDAAPFRAKLTDRTTALPPNRGEKLWADLDDADAARAYEALRALAADPKQAVSLVRGRVKPARAPEATRLKKLIADLDSDDFATRMEAKQELEKLGDVAAPALREALKSAGSAEQRRQLETILSALSSRGVAGEQLRLVRAVELLETVGSAEAREFLKELAAGAPGANETREARAALTRLGGR